MLGLGKEMREIGSVVEEVELEREEGTLAKKCGSSRSVFIEVAHSLPRDLPHSTRLKHTVCEAQISFEVNSLGY